LKCRLCDSAGASFVHHPYHWQEQRNNHTKVNNTTRTHKSGVSNDFPIFVFIIRRNNGSDDCRCVLHRQKQLGSSPRLI
jgi:hypothetical protein